jgi:hypothetical protein
MVRRSRLNYEGLDLGPKWTVQRTILRRLGPRWVNSTHYRSATVLSAQPQCAATKRYCIVIV